MSKANITVYGIPNCDNIKKTLDWFKAHGQSILFHDYKKEGISKEALTKWCKQVGWEVLLNKKSTTWRGLTPEQQAGIKSQAAAISLMRENNSIIKRPVIEFGDQLLVGFDDKMLTETFK